MEILHEIAARLDSLVTTEGVLESRLGRASLRPGAVQTVSTDCGADPYEYDDVLLCFTTPGHPANFWGVRQRPRDHHPVPVLR